MNLKELAILDNIKRHIGLFDINTVRELEAIAADELDFRREQAAKDKD